jgi:hypothetical protein
MKKYLYLFCFSGILIASCNSTPPRKLIDIDISSSGQITKGEKYWQDKDDCSLQGNLTKQDKFLVIDIDVLDDMLSNDGDNIELFFDVRPYRLSKRNFYEKGVVQVRVFPVFSEKQPNGAEFIPNYFDSEIEGLHVSSKIKPKSDGYTMKIKIPINGFNNNHYPVNEYFTFDICINDKDGEETAQMTFFGNKNNWRYPLNFKMVEIKN